MRKHAFLEYDPVGVHPSPLRGFPQHLPPRRKDYQILTFFYADFGKEFPSRTSWRGPSRMCPSPSSAQCPLLYRTEHFSMGRKGRKCAEKRGGRGVARKGGKKEKRTRENRSELIRQTFSPIITDRRLPIFLVIAPK